MPGSGRRARWIAALGWGLFAAALATLGSLLAGCSDDTPTGPPPIYSSIVITGPDSLLIGQAGTFSAVVLDTAGQVVSNPQISWRSSATAISTVSGGGVARGVSEGDATITAQGGGVVSNARTLAVFPGYGWVNQSGGVPTVLDLHGVHFVTAREGWAVGDNGTILHTTDAGANWSLQPSFSTAYTLNAVWFVSPAIGVVVGSAGRILRTTNGGNTWNVVTADTDNLRGLNHVYFQDEIRGWIVGNNGLVLRTSNAGATWTRVLPGVTAADLQRVSFPRASGSGPLPADPYGFGWAVGAGGTILGSDDFGQTWRLYVPFATADPLFAVARRNRTAAVALGANNRALYTVASADSAQWLLAGAPTPFSNFTAAAWPSLPAAAGPLWAAGRRTDIGQPVVMVSDDGGLTWSAQALPGTAPLTGNSIEDVYFLDDGRGWAVGTQGIVLHTVNGGR